MNTEMRNETETLADQRLFTYDLVILAGGAGTVSLPGQGQRARALAMLKGRRLLEYIREAVRQSRRVASVVLVTHSAHVNAFRQAAPDLLLCVCDGSMAECAAAAIQKLREQPGHENITRVVTVCPERGLSAGVSYAAAHVLSFKRRGLYRRQRFAGFRFPVSRLYRKDAGGVRPAQKSAEAGGLAGSFFYCEAVVPAVVPGGCGG